MLPPELTETEHKSMAFRAILSGKASTPKSAVPFMNALSEAGRQARVAEAKEDRK
jgi:Mrp family chromosome partitioning ATPase